MVKQIVSISIDDKYKTYCKDHKISISKWVNRKMSEEFIGYEKKIEKLEKDKTYLDDEIKNIKKEKEDVKQKYEEMIKKLTSKQKEEFENGAEIIKRKGPSFMEGRYRRYIHMFGKIINYEEFKAVILRFR